MHDSALRRDLAVERAHGGIVHRSGDMVTMGDGSRLWLNGQPWARDESDAAIAATRRLTDARLMRNR